MTLQVSCLSFRPPYAGLVLDGVKTLESRWRPLLAPLEGGTLAVHVAWRDWEGDDWRELLHGVLGLDRAETEALLASGERFGRGVVAGLVDVGETWRCSAPVPEDRLRRLQRDAVLTELTDKHLTRLSNPRWLRAPLQARGGRHLWTVDIPLQLLP